jgi:hypothetical protein
MVAIKIAEAIASTKKCCLIKNVDIPTRMKTIVDKIHIQITLISFFLIKEKQVNMMDIK